MLLKMARATAAESEVDAWRKVIDINLDEAVDLFERLLALRNGLGLLSEEYDPVHKRLIGNFPQGFSHIGLINTANNLAKPIGPAHWRAG
jgi:GH15 family glucan-1,4-alpha-glucosidase